MLNFQLENACNTLKNKRKTKSCEFATALSTLCVRFFVKKPLLVLESESESDGTHFFTPSSTRHNAEHRCCGLAHTHMHFSSLYIPYNSALSQLPGVGDQLTTEYKNTKYFKTTMAFASGPFAFTSYFFPELCCAI